MGTLLSIAARSTLRLLATLCVVVLTLLAAKWLMGEYASWDQAQAELQIRESALKDLEAYQHVIERSVESRVPAPTQPVALVQQQANRLQKELRDLETRRSEQERGRPPLMRAFVTGPTLESVRPYIDSVKLDIEYAAVQQALAYTQRLSALMASAQECARQELAAQSEMMATAAAIRAKISALEALNDSLHIPSWIPFSQAGRERRALIAEIDALTNLQHAATAKYDAVRVGCAARKQMGRFVFDRSVVDPLLQPIREGIEPLKDKVNATAVMKWTRPIIDVLPVALGIVVGIVLSPFVVKAIAYYLIAPIVERCKPISLLPLTNGQVEVLDLRQMPQRMVVPSAVTQTIVPRGSEELLVHGNYLQSSALASKKDTRWLLDWSMPLTSLAAGLYGLIRVEGNGIDPIVLSSSTDPLQELAVLSLPIGSALVLQPRCLIGVVKQRSQRIRVTRHWRLGHLVSWLTLQLRYIVFHGPVTLVVRGCRGVRVEAVDAGRMINRAATLGFSANVAYSSHRCETFGSYLLGQQALFCDRFSSGAGAYIYEETPRLNAKTGITGRGIEGVLDSLFKVVGL